MLDADFHGASQAEIESVPVEFVELELTPRGETTADVLAWLRQTYTGTIGYEYEHLEHPERREWLRDQIETPCVNSSNAWGRLPLLQSNERPVLLILSGLDCFA